MDRRLIRPSDMMADVMRDPSTILWSVLAITLWLVCGYAMIIFNKLVLSTWKFNFPFFLTAWHMLVATICTRLLAAFTNYLPGVKDGKVSNRIFLETIVPAGVYFSLGVVLGCSAFAYITVGYIQMIKAVTPVPLLILYFLHSREKLSYVQLIIVSVISLGVIISSVGEMRFSWVGFALQLSAVCSDCMRLLTIDGFLKDSKIDSLSLLYYLAPVSLVLVSTGFYFLESNRLPLEALTPSFCGVLLASGILSFSLNFAALFAINTTSGLVVSVCGPIKDILVIITSAVFFASPVMPLQWLGFAISIFGIFLYQRYKQDAVAFAASIDEALRCVRSSLGCDVSSSSTRATMAISASSASSTPSGAVMKLSASAAAESLAHEIDALLADDDDEEDSRLVGDVEMQQEWMRNQTHSEINGRAHPRTESI